MVSLRELARGVASLFPGWSPPTAETFAATQVMEEFLPPGERCESPQVHVDTVPPTAPTGPRKPRLPIPARLEFLRELGPKDIVEGVCGTGVPYLAFVFPRTVVLECVIECNALYLLDSTVDWMAIARLPKSSLLRERPAGFLGRVTHHGDWESRLKDFVLRGGPAQ